MQKEIIYNKKKTAASPRSAVQAFQENEVWVLKF